MKRTRKIKFKRIKLLKKYKKIPNKNLYQGFIRNKLLEAIEYRKANVQINVTLSNENKFNLLKRN